MCCEVRNAYNGTDKLSNWLSMVSQVRSTQFSQQSFMLGNQGEAMGYQK
jgi:hypothetical protein